MGVGRRRRQRTRGHKDRRLCRIDRGRSRPLAFRPFSPFSPAVWEKPPRELKHTSLALILNVKKRCRIGIRNRSGRRRPSSLVDPARGEARLGYVSCFFSFLLLSMNEGALNSVRLIFLRVWLGTRTYRSSLRSFFLFFLLELIIYFASI